MRPEFPLFKSPLDLAHRYWERLLSFGDMVIDATCGNGKDTLQLAQILMRKGGGTLIGLDIQQEAINNTRTLLETHLDKDFLQYVSLLCQSHAQLPAATGVKLVVYNLGYLPGGDKSLTTLTSSTWASVQQAMQLIVNGGAISLTCYPGHLEGEREYQFLVQSLSTLPASEWSVCEHRWTNRPYSPILFLLQKKIN